MIHPKLDRHDQLTQDARSAYASHQIRHRDKRSWLLQRRYEDGDGWDGCFATEVVSLWGGALYVGGDIEHVIFARYSDKGEAVYKVRWMGRHDEVDGYVSEKATIGTGRKLIEHYDRAIAEFDLARELERIEKEDGDWPGALSTSDQQLRATMREMIHRAPYYREELMNRLHATGSDFVHDATYIGIVTAPRVYYAHAALRRLCELLDEETKCT
jgi:hypothetical protein